MNNKKATRIIYGTSAAVLGLVVLLYNLPQAQNIPEFVKHLPKLHASINATCFVLLLLSLPCKMKVVQAVVLCSQVKYD